MNDIVYFMISYSVVIFGIIFFVNWWSNGFLWAFLKTKAGRGKKVLTIVNGLLDSYASKGYVEGKRFYYFDRETKKDNKNKVPKFIDMVEGQPNPIRRLFNVPVVTIDEVTGKFVTQDKGELVGGFDPILQENRVIRALERPNENDKILLICILIGVILLVLLGAFTVFNVLKIPAQIESLKAITSVVGVNV